MAGMDATHQPDVQETNQPHGSNQPHQTASGVNVVVSEVDSGTASSVAETQPALAVDAAFHDNSERLLPVTAMGKQGESC